MDTWRRVGWCGLLWVLVLGAACGKDAATPTPGHGALEAPEGTEDEAEYPIAPGGGIAGDPLQGATLAFPEGAVDREVRISIGRVPVARFTEPGVRVLSEVWRFRIDGRDHHRFAVPIAVTLPFDASRLVEGAHPGTSSISLWEEGRWRPVAGSFVEPEPPLAMAELEHFTVAAVTQPEDAASDRVVARWHVFASTTRESGPLIEAGAFGVGFWTPHARVATHYAFSAREEIVAKTNAPRTALGTFTWEGSTSDLYYEDKAGARLGGGDGGTGSGSISGDQAGLYVHLDVYQEESRGVMAGVSLQLPPELEPSYEVDVRDTELENDDIRRNVVVAGPSRRTRTRLRIEGLHLEGRVDDEGNGYFMESERGRSGTPGDLHGGFVTWSRHASAVRIVTPQALLIRGQTYHRIRMPRKAGDENWVHAQEPLDWATLAPLMIVPAGQVLVEATLLDTATGRALSPPLPVATQGDGSFELRLPLKPTATLRLVSTYTSQAARLGETTEMEIPLAALATGEPVGTEATWEVPVSRRSRVHLRYAGKPTEFDLGTEQRPAKARNVPEGVQLELLEKGALLVNTFCYRAKHVNQNRSAFTIRDAVVPQEELRATLPRGLQAEDFLSRVAQRIDANPTLEVPVRGWEICFPSSTLMALDALGLEQADTVGVGRLAQAIHDASPRPRTPDPARYRWWMPFPDPSRWSEETRRAYRNMMIMTGPEYIARLLSFFDLFRTHWPYVDAGDEPTSARQRKWIVTVLLGRSDYRPWQITDFVYPALKARHPGRFELESLGIDLFEPRHAGRLLQELGRGAAGTVSIAHLGLKRGGGTYRGTHVLAFLGVVVAHDGRIVRHLFHDPYGDLSQNPTAQGYYTEPRDVDEHGQEGAYVPYGRSPHVIQAWQRTIAGNYLNVLRPLPRPDPAAIRKRLLPGDG